MQMVVGYMEDIENLYILLNLIIELNFPRLGQTLIRKCRKMSRCQKLINNFFFHLLKNNLDSKLTAFGIAKMRPTEVHKEFLKLK